MTTDAAQVANLVRYTHLDKTHGYLPGMRTAQPAIFGLTAAEFDLVRRQLADAVDEAATELLTRPPIVEASERLARCAVTVLAVGDSLTDDLQSWLEIIRAVLDLHSPDHDVRLLNQGLSAHSTAMVLRRWPSMLSIDAPDVVVCGLGGNDVTRVGANPRKPMVSATETIANLHEMRRIATESAEPEWIWLTPASVDEGKVAAWPAFRLGRSSWSNADIEAVAERVRGLPGRLVDLVQLFGIPPDPELIGDDGVHPTVSGQAAIAAAVIGELADAAERVRQRDAS